MADNLSRLPDRELLTKLRGYNNTSTVAPKDFNLETSDADALKTDLDDYETALDEWDAIQIEYDTKLEAKNAARRKVYERGKAQRDLTRAKQGISNETLAAAGLEIYDTTKTASPSPTSVPFVIVDLGKLRQTLNFRDAATPDTDAKPDGMLGCEIWKKIGGDAPVDNTDCEYVVTDTATPYTVKFSGADAGKTVWYLLRWVSKNGDKGDWSEAVSATING